MRGLFSLLLLMLCAQSAIAFNINGHRIVAQIAYQKLSPEARQWVDSVTPALFSSPKVEVRFGTASAWPDIIKRQDVSAFNHWHYINLEKSGHSLVATRQENVVWAIGQSQKTAFSAKAKPIERAMFLSFLLHFVADVHQPLHCDGAYAGGNDFAIQAGRIRNLHAYWDAGAGLLQKPKKISYGRWLQSVADRVTQEYPETALQQSLQQGDAMQWAVTANHIANNVAYTLPRGSVPSQEYAENTQRIVSRQLALAGYRLAHMINKVASSRQLQPKSPRHRHLRRRGSGDL